jgi:phage baseplate assembly protein W
MADITNKYIMTNRYLKLPLRLESAIEGHELPSCSLVQSITKSLELIIVTRFGEHRADPDFGCEIWDLDFELIVSARLWEEKLRQSLLHSITTHEHRLTGISVDIQINDVEKMNYFRKFTEIKKRVDIGVTGIIQKTGESFSFGANMYLSPLSLD